MWGTKFSSEIHHLYTVTPNQEGFKAGKSLKHDQFHVFFGDSQDKKLDPNAHFHALFQEQIPRNIRQCGALSLKKLIPWLAHDIHLPHERRSLPKLWKPQVYWLVVYQPLWKILVSWDDCSQYIGKKNHVPNHQPVIQNVSRMHFNLYVCISLQKHLATWIY